VRRSVAYDSLLYSDNVMEIKTTPNANVSVRTLVKGHDIWFKGHTAVLLRSQINFDPLKGDVGPDGSISFNMITSMRTECSVSVKSLVDMMNKEMEKVAKHYNQKVKFITPELKFTTKAFLSNPLTGYPPILVRPALPYKDAWTWRNSTEHFRKFTNELLFAEASGLVWVGHGFWKPPEDFPSIPDRTPYHPDFTVFNTATAASMKRKIDYTFESETNEWILATHPSPTSRFKFERVTTGYDIISQT